MTLEVEKKIVEAADADFIVGKTRPIGTRERYLYEEKRESFLNGVSFGRKGMYTEEEVKKLIALKNMEDHNNEFPDPMGISVDESMYQIEDWFEQNKKKEE